MGYLFKRKNSKYWQACYKDVSGQDRYASTGTIFKRDAQKHLAELVVAQEQLRRKKLDTADPLLEILQKAVSEARKGQLTASRTRVYLHKISLTANGEAHGPITLRSWVQNWLESKRPLVGDSTWNRYKANLDGFVEKLSAAADKDLYALTPEQVEAAVLSFRSGDIRASTVNFKLADLRTTLEEARNRGLVERNVAKLVRKLSEEDIIVRAPFTLDEIRKLVATATMEWRGFILFAVYTGLRMADVADIKVKNIDSDKKLLTVQMKKRKRGLKPKIVQVPLAEPVDSWFSAKGLTAGSSDSLFPILGKLPTSTLLMGTNDDCGSSVKPSALCLVY